MDISHISSRLKTMSQHRLIPFSDRTVTLLELTPTSPTMTIASIHLPECGVISVEQKYHVAVDVVSVREGDRCRSH
jgi:hypothetical protein